MEAVTAQGGCTVDVNYRAFICLFYLTLKYMLRMLAKSIWDQNNLTFLSV